MPKALRRSGTVGKKRGDALMGTVRRANESTHLVADVKKLRETYGLKQETVTRLSGFSPRAVANWASGKQPSEATAKRLREMERLLDALAGVVESKAIDPWLKRPNEVFEGSTPLQVIERGEGDRIWRMIYELASGEPS